MLKVCCTVNNVQIGLANTKFCFFLPSWLIVALTTLRLKVGILLDAVTERNDGGGSEGDDVGVLDTVSEDGWCGILFEGNGDANIGGPSTIRVAHGEIQLRFPFSWGKKAVPSQLSLSHTFLID